MKPAINICDIAAVSKIKKALKKGEYLQGSNAVSLKRYGPAQGGEAGGE